MNLIKKAILYAAVPIMMGGCSVALSTIESIDARRDYESTLILKVRNRSDIEHLTDSEFMDYWNIKFKNSVYNSYLGYDSDGDGIINIDDIWRYEYGPFVDSNRNGIVDMFDWQIAGFGNPYIDNYPFRMNDRWIGIDVNPFWKTEYFNRHTNYFNVHKKYRHHEKKYIRSYEVRHNKKRATHNTRIRRDNTSKRSSGAIIRSTQSKRISPKTIQNTRNNKIKTTPPKKYIKPIIRKTQARTTSIKRSSTVKRKSTTVKRPAIKRSTTSKRQGRFNQ